MSPDDPKAERTEFQRIGGIKEILDLRGNSRQKAQSTGVEVLVEMACCCLRGQSSLAEATGGLVSNCERHWRRRVGSGPSPASRLLSLLLGLLCQLPQGYFACVP